MIRAFFWIMLTVLSGCSREPLPIAPPSSSGELVVLVHAASQDFNQGEPVGLIAFETDLVRAFADSLGLKLRLVPVNDFAELADSLTRFRAHMAIGSITTDWPVKARFSVPIRKLRYLLVEHEGGKRGPASQPLAGRTLGVLAHSPAAELARRITRDAPHLTVLNTFRTRDDMQLLKQVAVGRLDVVLTDELHFKLASRLFPTLQKLHELPEPAQLVWAFPPGSANEYLPEADAFIERARSNGMIHRLLDRHVAPDHAANEEDMAIFIERMTRVLPDLREVFFTAEEQTGVDWRLLAAIAYQESHWDPLAISPTGVRGIMMLTEETADHLKVRDRLDPRESILGGARYFASLRDTLPDDIPEPDRTWLALASYNIGPGHMNGVLTIARSMGRDVRSWVDMKRVLPLMSQPEFAQRLKSGVARGGEAVAMAENVRSFFEILKYFQKPYASLKNGTVPVKGASVLAEQPVLPRLGNMAPSAIRVSAGKAGSQHEPPTIPKTLAPQGGLDQLAPEAAALVRERLGGAAPLNP